MVNRLIIAATAFVVTRLTGHGPVRHHRNVAKLHEHLDTIAAGFQFELQLGWQVAEVFDENGERRFYDEAAPAPSLRTALR